MTVDALVTLRVAQVVCSGAIIAYYLGIFIVLLPFLGRINHGYFLYCDSMA